MSINPKWTGCMPSFTTTGRKMGVKIRTAGVMSMKVPTIRSSILMMRKMTILLSDSDRSAALTFWGTCSIVMIHAMHMDVAIRSITMDVVMPHWSRISGSCFSFTFL